MSEESKVEDTKVDTTDVDDDDGFGADFAAAVKEDEGQVEDPPSKTETEEAKPDKEAPAQEAPAEKPPAAAETTDDLWKDAPPALRAAYEQERTRADQAETTVRRHSGRLSALQTQLNTLQGQLGERNESGATPKGEEAKDKEERRKQLREEFPDSVGKVLDEVIALEEQVTALKTSQSRATEEQSESLLEEQLDVLNKAHPDWQDVRKDPRYEPWLREQPGYVQHAVLVVNAKQIVDGASAADVLTRFKESIKEPDPKKEQHDERRAEQMEALKGVDTRKPPSGATGEGSYEEEFDRFVKADARQASR